MKDKILNLLAEICEDDIVKMDVETELFDSGILDSLGFAEFLAELEEQFDIVIAPSEIEREDVDTPQKIWELVEERI